MSLSHQQTLRSKISSVFGFSKPPEEVKGKWILHVTVKRAEIFRDAQIIGQMDPFMVFEVRSKKYQTRALSGGGMNPVWEETLLIPVQSMTDFVKVTCYDEDLIIHAMVAQKVYQAQDLVGTDVWISLDFKGEEAAKVLLDTKCVQSSNDPAP